MKTKTTILGLASAFALGLGSCASDEVVSQQTDGDAISFTSRVSRAVPTTLETLDGFHVYANVEGYTSMLINGLNATKSKDGGNTYELENKITWPSDAESIRFWAYGPLSLGYAPDFTHNTQMIRRIKVTPDLKVGGLNHKDLVVAYNKAERTGENGVKGMAVPLDFHHAFSQIEVKVKKGEGFEKGRVVKIKGIWIVNAHSEGKLECDFTHPDLKNHMLWETNTAATYGVLADDGSRIGNGVLNVISNAENGGSNSSLMLLPQRYDAWNPEGQAQPADGGTSDRTSNYNNTGMYILVLCRVETEHEFDPTPEGMAENSAVGPMYNESGEIVGHTHQLFPVTKDEEGNDVYEKDIYGYSCVPISGEWEPGKKYVYMLEFCGKKSGAGVYPPDELPEGLPEVPKRPDDKKPGDPVLDDPITFTVTVTEWENGGDPDSGEVSTPMN